MFQRPVITGKFSSSQRLRAVYTCSHVRSEETATLFPEYDLLVLFFFKDLDFGQGSPIIFQSLNSLAFCPKSSRPVSAKLSRRTKAGCAPRLTTQVWEAGEATGPRTGPKGLVHPPTPPPPLAPFLSALRPRILHPDSTEA